MQTLLVAARGTQSGIMNDADFIEIYLSEFRSRYDVDPAKVSVSQEDTERWQTESGLPKTQLLDAIAFRLAFGFYCNKVDFDFCSVFMRQLKNSTHGNWPELFWNIFIAFDAGEFCHDRQGGDPIETHTRPMIREILDRKR